MHRHPNEQTLTIPLRCRDGSVRAVATIDATDAHLARWHWHFGPNGYVARKLGNATVFLHRAILGLHLGDVEQVDHINRDKLDNRRANLRIVTAAQNGQNRPGHAASTSRYRGVSWSTRAQRWDARLRVDGRVRWLGYFEDEDQANAAVTAARKLYMPFSID